MFSKIYTQQLINTLQDIESTSQFISSDYLFQLMRTRKEGVRKQFLSLPGSITYSSGFGETAKLISIKTVTSYLSDMLDNSNTVTIPTQNEYSVTGTPSPTILLDYGISTHQVFEILQQTFGDIGSSTTKYNVKDYFPSFVYSLKLNSDNVTKVTQTDFINFIQESGLFVPVSKLNFMYVYELSLTELLEMLNGLEEEEVDTLESEIDLR